MPRRLRLDAVRSCRNAVLISIRRVSMRRTSSFRGFGREWRMFSTRTSDATRARRGPSSCRSEVRPLFAPPPAGSLMLDHLARHIGDVERRPPAREEDGPEPVIGRGEEFALSEHRLRENCDARRELVHVDEIGGRIARKAESVSVGSAIPPDMNPARRVLKLPAWSRRW